MLYFPIGGKGERAWREREEGFFHGRGWEDREDSRGCLSGFRREGEIVGLFRSEFFEFLLVGEKVWRKF